MQTPQLHILILQTGHAESWIAKQFGDSGAAFRCLLEHSPNCTTQTWAVCDTPDAPPDLSGIHGVVITGSASMLDQQLRWMDASKDFVTRALSAELPVLGVCFGHQLLGQLSGAAVGKNPNGRRNGTVLVNNLAKTDPLFKVLPDKFYAQVSHRDALLDLPNGLQRCGSAPHDPQHMIRFGKLAWGVQFHPEWDINVSRAYLSNRQSILEEELGLEEAQQLLDSLHESNETAALFDQFVKICRKDDKNAGQGNSNTRI